MSQGGFLKNKKSGFTLIELLVVISIIGLLSTVVLAGVQKVRTDAKWRKFDRELYEIKTAVQLYRENHNGNWPNTMARIDIDGGSIEDLLSELKNDGVYPANNIKLADSGTYPGIASSYKISGYELSCGNPGYKDVYYVLYFQTTKETSPGNTAGVSVPTKIPFLYENGIVNTEYVYCLDFR